MKSSIPLLILSIVFILIILYFYDNNKNDMNEDKIDNENEKFSKFQLIDDDNKNTLYKEVLFNDYQVPFDPANKIKKKNIPEYKVNKKVSGWYPTYVDDSPNISSLDECVQKAKDYNFQNPNDPYVGIGYRNEKWGVNADGKENPNYIGNVGKYRNTCMFYKDGFFNLGF
jgi:hypothetical protein